MKNIKLTNVKVDQLKTYFEEIDIKSGQTIEIGKNHITTKAYPKSKSYIKFKKIDTSDIFDGGDKIGDEVLKLPLVSLEGLNKILKFFSDGDVNITLSVDNGYVVKMVFDNGMYKYSNDSNEIDIVAAVLGDDVWSMFKSTDESYLNFSFPLVRIKEIIKLNDISSGQTLKSSTKSKNIAILSKDGGVVVTNNYDAAIETIHEWEYKVPQDAVISNTLSPNAKFVFSINTLKLIKNEENDFFLKDLPSNDETAVMIFKADEDSIVVGIAAKE